MRGGGVITIRLNSFKLVKRKCRGHAAAPHWSSPANRLYVAHSNGSAAQCAGDAGDVLRSAQGERRGEDRRAAWAASAAGARAGAALRSEAAVPRYHEVPFPFHVISLNGFLPSFFFFFLWSSSFFSPPFLLSHSSSPPPPPSLSSPPLPSFPFFSTSFFFFLFFFFERLGVDGVELRDRSRSLSAAAVRRGACDRAREPRHGIAVAFARTPFAMAQTARDLQRGGAGACCSGWHSGAGPRRAPVLGCLRAPGGADRRLHQMPAGDLGYLPERRAAGLRGPFLPPHADQ